MGFCRGFLSASLEDPSLALLYLAFPIAMSDDVQSSFSETNSRTGFLAWLNRYPEIRFGLVSRVEASIPFVSDSIRLGVSSRALVLTERGLVGLGSDAPAKVYADRLPTEARQVIRRAERLGIWMAGAGTVGSIFSAFGVLP
ncbi:three component ABC system middle component [Bradyrhizobium oligotrophicum]|uniref:three component ABC system middle component n=1 Tax=Bradyrhizobium oligotrophicum TaxID=44255 RepID=UPI003EBA4AA8